MARDGPFGDGINSGQPDSICTTIPAASHGATLPVGVSSSHRAFSGAPGYYEVGLPTGDYLGQPPRGVMLVVHGRVGGFGRPRSPGDASRRRPLARARLEDRQPRLPCVRTERRGRAVVL